MLLCVQRKHNGKYSYSVMCACNKNKNTEVSVSFDYTVLKKGKKPTAMELLNAIVKPNDDIRRDSNKDSK